MVLLREIRVFMILFLFICFGIIYMAMIVLGSSLLILDIVKPFYRWLMLIEDESIPQYPRIPERDPEL